MTRDHGRKIPWITTNRRYGRTAHKGMSMRTTMAARSRKSPTAETATAEIIAAANDCVGSVKERLIYFIDASQLNEDTQY